jgi:hypothetical protein
MSEFSINLPPRLPNAGPAPNILTAVIPDPPRQLAQLDNGTIIKGTVQGRDPDGLLVVVTDKGALKLSTPANIPSGTQVTLEVRSAGDRLQVFVLAVENQPASGASGQGPRTGSTQAPATSTNPQTQAPPPTTGTTPPPAPVAIVGGVLHGTIVQTAPDTLTQLIRSLLPAPPAAQLAVPPPGQPASLPAPATQAPALPGQPASSAAQPQTAAPAQAATGQESLPKVLVSALQADVRAKIEALFFSAPPAKGAAASALPTQLTGTLAPGTPGTAQSAQALAQALKLPIALTTGSEVRLRLIAVASAPGQPLAIATPAAAAQHTIAGRIIGYTPAGNAVLHSPLGAIILQGALHVPVGTELSMAVEPALPTPAALSASTSSLPQLLLSVARSWPSLTEAIVLLRQNASNADALAVLARLPQAGPKLAAGLVAAMQALRTGDAEALLGALVAARAGGTARDETARKVRQEFAQVSALAQDRPGVDWRCCFIPILDDGTIRQINLFYRRDRRKDRKDAKDEKSGTRFIVEVDMSRMGPFQFDGLVREKQFDLMVRSHIALPQKFRHDITELFHEALALGDYRGGLAFQKVRDFPVSPLEEIEKSATSVSA